MSLRDLFAEPNPQAPSADDSTADVPAGLKSPGYPDLKGSQSRGNSKVSAV